MSDSTSSIIDFLRKSAANPPQDGAERKQVAAAAHDLARAVEPVYDQAQRVIYSHTVLPVMDTANDMGLLAILSNPLGKGHSMQELAKSTGADGKLLSMTALSLEFSQRHADAARSPHLALLGCVQAH